MYGLILFLALNRTCDICHLSYQVGQPVSIRQMREFTNSVSRHHNFKLSIKDKDAIITISKKENVGRVPTKKNPRSSAYGLFQFLDSTWKTVGEKKTTCPKCQFRAGIKYILQRYGSGTKALIFKLKRGYY